ncbi:hypothetical protein G7B40_019805 [Aetokthonos hydrillicola Thurmond2011]|jgi:hypothetical protein|uniref:Uncharacterized protein n=1 Tax=Aetokthonos hydrillicola Thurmond2011 TaxID=2712845 RepID=A0AAP5MAG9_9CYAN|nr:hypothetical protein [Aetokthonos hydrillicola]MBO3463013.1 hypothetical protein [Aetokthonos hydrillicola CCALA 1050]MBW4587184.1 hypothetical protein [Aetokthonos hydrillicola CCALA 1050]MDR9896792.1 hypothetical protein [Aetokthonos hydrillicola Thurmond2011]
MANYPGVFKTALGEVAIKKNPLTPYTVIFPNHKITRQVSINSCGYAVLKNKNISILNLPLPLAEGQILIMLVFLWRSLYRVRREYCILQKSLTRRRRSPTSALDLAR